MKRLLYLLPVLLVLVSCKKFLDTKPADFLSPVNYYSTEAELNTALIGVYDPISNGNSLYGNWIPTYIEACSDESFFARNTQTTDVEVYNFSSNETHIADYWSAFYTGIERANLLIANIQKPAMDSTARNKILAQALFLRAFYYFQLVQSFGDVPLKITPTGSVTQVAIARTPAKDVYAQIVKDMTWAEANLPTSTANGSPSRVSKTIAQGILSRVCLTMAGYPLNDATKYAEALAWAQKVVASGEHNLKVSYDASLTNTAYSQIFINHVQDKYDIKESMWEAEFSGNNTSTYQEAGRIGNQNGIAFTGTFPAGVTDTIGYCYGFLGVTNRLYKLYGAGDLRRDWAIAPYNYNNTTFARNYFAATAIYQRNPGKWRRSYELLLPRHKNNTPTNFPLLRYADVLLMLAEAENQVNGPTTAAYDAINQVRRRGYGVPIGTVNATADLPAGYSKAQFQQAIQDERSRELCFEGLRRNDLVRWGIFVTTLNSVGAEITADPVAPTNFKYAALGGTNVAPRHLLFPIPLSEMSVNKSMTQNPGW
ncbi:MAG TPA: RagB/SusD family nutrient uptake outer membrane protein [Chitinophagaceae bacterium]|nr:RagB/SusD family nutrient uptake outer membrane protein [Chitinophagaceae bacterium]HMU57255.1 RagB/SusD family nutrient uptake outer membrane protein [Chitinophagaceae bacterium]